MTWLKKICREYSVKMWEFERKLGKAFPEIALSVLKPKNPCPFPNWLIVALDKLAPYSRSVIFIQIVAEDPFIVLFNSPS
jgi:hypothetical protein